MTLLVASACTGGGDGESPASTSSIAATTEALTTTEAPTTTEPEALTLTERVAQTWPTMFLPTADEISALVRSHGFLPLGEWLLSPNGRDALAHRILGPLCPSMASMTESLRSDASTAHFLTGRDVMQRALENDPSARSVSVSIHLFFDVTPAEFERTLDDILIATGGTSACDSQIMTMSHLSYLAEQNGFMSSSSGDIDSEAFSIRKISTADRSGAGLRLITGPGSELRQAIGADRMSENFAPFYREVVFHDAGHVSAIGFTEEGRFLDQQALFPLTDIDAAIHIQIQSASYNSKDDREAGVLTIEEEADLVGELVEFAAELAQQTATKLSDWISASP